MTDSMARSNNGSAVRGVVLVLVAIVVGVLLLRSSDNSTAAISAGASDTDAITAPGVTQPVPAETSLPAVTATTEAAPTEDSAVAPTESIEVTESTTVETVPEVTGFVPHPAAEVKVQVANSTSTKGAAGTVSDQFKTLNYIVATPTNMRGTALATTRVHYQPGSLLEAQAIATVLGLDPKNDVFQMFQDTAAIEQWDDPDVLIALGEDLAGG